MTAKKAPAKTRAKSVVKKPVVVADDARLRKKPKYKSFRMHKRVKHPATPLPSWRKITGKSLSLLRANLKNILWFSLIYGLLYLLFVRGFGSPVDVDGVRESFEGVADQNTTALVTNFTVFSLLVESTTSAAGGTAGLYQVLFLTIGVLALVWLFRQQQAGNNVSMKDAFYRGMYPLVPFFLVGLVVLFQLLPAMIGNYLFSTVIQSGLAVSALEQIVWLLLFLSLLLLSFYLISSSLIALFVVTLPEMTPIRSLKKAKELVTFRRFSVLRKIFGLVLAIILLFVVVVFPLIFVSAAVAQIVFFLLTVFVVPFAVSFMFVLYRELL